MIELISEHEMEMMDKYRRLYAGQSDLIEDRIAPMSEILIPWERAKEYFLKKVFDGKLILRKRVKMEKPIHILRDEMDHLIYGAPHENGHSVFVNKVFSKVRSVINATYDVMSDEWGECIFQFNQLFRMDSLINNQLQRELIIPAYGNITKTVLNKGMKTMKAIRIITQKYGLSMEEFEKFRIAHSMILNGKTMYGTLCLSIHPFDYMTMSDNSNDWSSCMSWLDNGCYRQGTVEMMNSGCVVVGYLESDDRKFQTDNIEWNNKKWRCLYFVNENFISNIKQYPFNSNELNKTCLTWLKELVQNAYPDIKYSDDFAFEDDNFNDESYPFVDTKHFGSFYPTTNVMYNDFGHSRHTGYANINNEKDWEYEVNLSGDRECMCCGRTNEDFYTDDNLMCGDEGILACKECDSIRYCAYCGSRIDNVTHYTVDEQEICENCFETASDLDSFTGKRHLIRDMTNYVIVDKDKYLFSLLVHRRDAYNFEMKGYLPVEKTVELSYAGYHPFINYSRIVNVNKIHNIIWAKLLHNENFTANDFQKFIENHSANAKVEYLEPMWTWDCETARLYDEDGKVDLNIINDVALPAA